MRNTKWKYILQTLVVVSVLASLLVSMNGCKKKKPDTTESSSTAETTTETTGSAENTKPSNSATENTTPSQNTNPSEDTSPTEGTTAAVCEHILGNWIVAETSNCTKEGSRYKECTLCKEKVVTEAIPKTTHTASKWIVDEKATCTTQGKQHQECTQCEEKIASIVVAKADHNAKTIPGYVATTTTPGLTDGVVCRTCSTDVQEQFVIPIVGTVPYTIQTSDTTCTITGLGSWTGSELILPATIDGKTVTAIGSNAFANRTSIKTVYIPKSVTQIGEKAFSGCSALTNITYEGTVIQWSTSVAKGTQWNQNTGSYKIYCTNNILSK